MLKWKVSLTNEIMIKIILSVLMLKIFLVCYLVTFNIFRKLGEK